VSAGAGLFLGVLSASVAALPAALRTDSSFLVWLSLAGATASVLGPLLAARSTLRPAEPGLLAFAIGIGLAAGPVALLLSMLKSNTHHRPLGAVTFAFAAAIVTAVTCIGTLRLQSGFQPESKFASPARFGLIVFALLGPLLLIVRLAGEAQARSSLFDAGLALGVAAVALLVPWPARLMTLAQRVGPLVWAAVVGIGFLSARASREAALEASPALLAPFTWLLR
jgi:hypothetical protein